MRRLGLRPRADLLLRVEHLIELVVLVPVGPRGFAFHAFVARGHELARILLPNVERLELLLERKFFIIRKVGWTSVLSAGCSTLCLCALFSAIRPLA
jgi:hypothetical protein